MSSGRIYLIGVLIVILLLIAAGWILIRSRSDRVTASPLTNLDCCQCTALGEDRLYPFPQVPGYTCHEYCYQGCLERGNSEIVCKIGGVTGYELECPDVLLPTVTPFGE
jgi:hypothetical protein